jgi:hypothetical protein
MSTAHYQAIVAAPGFALGVQCDDDEISLIEFLEPQPERAADAPLAAEAARQLHAWLADPAFVFGLPLNRRHRVPAPRLGADRGDPDRRDADLRRTRAVAEQRTARRRPGLRRQSLPAGRPVPPRRRRRRRPGRLQPPRRRLPARGQALAAAP